MTTTLGFDVYGTLIDTHGVIVELEKLIGEKAPAFSMSWRDKQLEYTFRRGLMGCYENFPLCTQQALEFTCQIYDVSFTQEHKQTLLDSYVSLPCFDDVKKGLEQLKANNIRMFAFSNGIRDDLERLLSHAEIRDYFIDIITVDDVKTFKPNPLVYEHFLQSTVTKSENAWLISSNAFDVIGAINCAMNAAWIQRTHTAVFDPWGIRPSITASSLIDLATKLEPVLNSS